MEDDHFMPPIPPPSPTSLYLKEVSSTAIQSILPATIYLVTTSLNHDIPINPIVVTLYLGMIALVGYAIKTRENTMQGFGFGDRYFETKHAYRLAYSIVNYYIASTTSSVLGWLAQGYGVTNTMSVDVINGEIMTQKNLIAYFPLNVASKYFEILSLLFYYNAFVAFLLIKISWIGRLRY